MTEMLTNSQKTAVKAAAAKATKGKSTTKSTKPRAKKVWITRDRNI